MVCAGVVLSVMKYLTYLTVLLADCTQNIHIFNIIVRLIIDPLKLLFAPIELKLTRFYFICGSLKLFHK